MIVIVKQPRGGEERRYRGGIARADTCKYTQGRRCGSTRERERERAGGTDAANSIPLEIIRGSRVTLLCANGSSARWRIFSVQFPAELADRTVRRKGIYCFNFRVKLLLLNFFFVVICNAKLEICLCYIYIYI